MAAPLCRVRQHGAHRCRVGRVHGAAPAHLTLALGGLLGKDVALVGAAALDAAARAHFEALRRAPFGFHLRHTSLSFHMTPGGPCLCKDASTATAITCNPALYLIKRVLLQPSGPGLLPSPACPSWASPPSPSAAAGPSSSAPAPSPSGGLRASGTAPPRRPHRGPCAPARAAARRTPCAPSPGRGSAASLSPCRLRRGTESACRA